MGISRGAAAAVRLPGRHHPSHLDVVAAQAANMELIDFAFKLTLPISLTAIAAMAVTHSSGSAIWMGSLANTTRRSP